MSSSIQDTSCVKIWRKLNANRSIKLSSSLLFAELLSPSVSSCADLSSPDPNDLQQHRRYPRGIINPNYPGFQHLAHTLAEHFIDHQFEHSSDSEISEDFDFDVAYRSGNLGIVNIMNDPNNNNDNINNNGEGPDKNIDLNRNKNRRSSFSLPENVVNDLSVMKESQQQAATRAKEFEDGNVNLMMKSEPKVFCESKQLGLNESHSEFETDDDDEDDDCNVPNSFKIDSDPHRMDFDDDELADLSGEDDAAIKNELENIDKADDEFHENIDFDIATYLMQYDYKMDVKKSYKYESERAEDECLTDEDNSKLPTPDILIEHNSKKLQNGEKETGTDEFGDKQSDVDVSPSDEMRDYQPDLIKNITGTINTNDNNQGDEKVQQSGEGDNEILSSLGHEIPADKESANDEKIINQEMEIELVQTVSRNLPLSFESATSSVDIIGDFGKEIEKEIGLIVSGYRNAAAGGRQAHQNIRQMRTQNSPELVFDENRFIEHLKYFSKVSDCHPFLLHDISLHICFFLERATRAIKLQLSLS